MFNLGKNHTYLQIAASLAVSLALLLSGSLVGSLLLVVVLEFLLLQPLGHLLADSHPPRFAGRADVFVRLVVLSDVHTVAVLPFPQIFRINLFQKSIIF